MPTWFLVFGLFFPRLTLLCAYFSGQVPHNEIPFVLDVIGSIFFPRFLIADYCYENHVHPLWICIFVIVGLAEVLGVGSKSRSED